MQKHNSARKALSFFCTPFTRDVRMQSAWQDCSPKRNYSAKFHNKSTDMSDATHPFFNYTSGRWLYNERLRLSERQLFFNVDELCRIIAKSIKQSNDDMIRFTKIAEGGSYRIFEATFRNGFQAIARLPYPSTIPPRYGIASEVATMEFLRLHSIPVPRIFDWNTSKSNNVGSEYIIMERVQGKELAETWQTMTFPERMMVIEKIVDVERKMFDIRFPANGSLFFKDFLDASVKTVDIPEVAGLQDMSGFCIGPSTEYLWWYQKRNDLAVNHGPWRSTEELLRAVGKREILWLQRFGERRYPHEPLYREIYNYQLVDPHMQINYLLDYLKVAAHLAPKAEQLNLPTIRHPDFSPSNIFISDSGDITGIIDWQHTVVLPIFLQAKIPKHFQNYGDDDSENFRRPKLADNYDKMAESDKENEMELYRRRQVHYCYIGYTNRLNKAHFKAMGKHSLILRNRLYDVAAQPWEGDNTSLQAELIKIMAQWSEITSPEQSPPLHYTSAEVDACLYRDAKQKEADDQVQHVRDLIGTNCEGWVSNDEYETAKEKAILMKREMAESLDTDEERREFDELWPFQDHEEIE